MENYDKFIIKELKRNQKIIIRNVPSVTYEEVKAFLGKFAISNIAISKRLRHAIVDLRDGEQAEQTVESLKATSLQGQKVEVSLFRKDNLLCLTNLPGCMKHQELRKLVEPLGALEKCCVWLDANGTSLGYAFFELQHNREMSELARIQLDGRIIDGRIIDGRIIEGRMVSCSFVRDTVLSIDQYQSRVVVVIGWPEELGHWDLNQFRRWAEMIAVKPMHCEHTCGGGIDCIGVVEFYTGLEAREFYRWASGFKFRSHFNATHSSGVSFGCPGETREDIFKRAVDKNRNEPAPKLSLQPLVNPMQLISPNPPDAHSERPPMMYPPPPSIYLNQASQPLVFLRPQQMMCQFPQAPNVVFVPVPAYYGMMPVVNGEAFAFGMQTQGNDVRFADANGRGGAEGGQMDGKEKMNRKQVKRLWRPKIFDDLRDVKKEFPPTVDATNIKKENDNMTEKLSTSLLSRKRSYRETHGIDQSQRSAQPVNQIKSQKCDNGKLQSAPMGNTQNSCTGKPQAPLNPPVKPSKSGITLFSGNTKENYPHNFVDASGVKGDVFSSEWGAGDGLKNLGAGTDGAPLLKKKKNAVFASVLGLCDNFKENVDVLPSSCKLAWLR